ncbi:colicin E5-related ribonuclease [Clostridium saccharoperbutylacetonicum]|uniref:colicin E5-related ribonuclease n=1 Tax=Clostridium saccharoperbutylacetonicum TaxID=36745 RepID=UPI001181C385|nr:colicin E5-related ribonuclease [Clostridium saccharoperbutylacetonicum]
MYYKYTYTTRESINKATGNSATVYYNEAGGYVIIDDITKSVVQISDNVNPSAWILDPSRIDKCKP